MKTIELSKIIVPESYMKSTPNPNKIRSALQYAKENRKLDKPIVLQGNMVVDNYIRYLVAKELNLREVPYVTSQEYREELNKTQDMNYVVGEFYNCQKQYMWKNPKRLKVSVGDKVLVQSKDKFNKKSGTSVITVVKIFNSSNQKLLRHKNIIRVVRHAE